MPRLPLIIVTLALCSSAAAAGPIDLAGFGTFGGGVRYLALGDLNDFLDHNELDRAADWWPAYSLQGYAIVAGRGVIGGQGSFSRQDIDGSDVDLRLINSYAVIEGGYLLLNSSAGLLFPYLGLGLFEQSINFHGQAGFVALDDQNPEAEDDDDLSLSRDGMLLSLGAAYYYPVRFAHSDSGRFAMFLSGVRLGGCVELFGDELKDAGDHELIGGPEMRLDALWLQLELGFGGGREARSDQTAP